jgi:S-adenosylmethionine hydrolase
MLFAGTRHFPGGTVHIGVVDPDVGSTRRRLALKAGGRYYVGPDNGLFGIVIDEVGLEQVVELAARPEAAPTFEGRDVFAPAAAALASGVPLDSLGHRTDPPRMLDNSSPRILWVDGFGNLVTNLKPPVRPMRIHSHYITAAAKTYWDAKPNEPFVYVGSMGYLEIAVREQRADRMLGARSGMQIELI